MINRIFQIFAIIMHISRQIGYIYCTIFESFSVENCNNILSAFDFNYYGFDQQIIDLTKSLIFCIDNGPFSASESLYIRISDFPIQNFQYYILILKAKNTGDDQMLTSIFSVSLNVKDGVSIQKTQDDEFSIRIDKKVDITKLIILVSNLGIASRQEIVFESDNPILRLYSDIFGIYSVTYSLNTQIQAIPAEYVILNNKERSLATIYKSFQNAAYSGNVSTDKIEKMKEIIVLESMCNYIRNKTNNYLNRSRDDLKDCFEEYVLFIKSIIKIIAFTNEKHNIDDILNEIQRTNELRKTLAICYSNAKLINEKLEKEIRMLF